jgi:two-component system sensor histidine kinase KdpD
VNSTTAALAFLLVVLIVAAMSTRRIAVLTSLVAFACYNFFFLRPTGTLTIANRDDAIALFALLAVSLIGSHLSHQARSRAAEAVSLAKAHNEAEMARRSAEAKSTLVASVSHDLKTPLTALTIATGNLMAPGLSESERNEQAQLIQAELERLTRLFNNIIEMASIETRALSAELQWVQPAEIIEAALRQTAGKLVSRDVRVTDDADQRLVCLDPRLTSAAVGHVLENAAAYSPPAESITVNACLKGDELLIEVRDHGPGLPVDDMERVFERFYRGSGAADRFGTGMGLAIARGLVAVQGGRMSADNHPQGGAIFTIAIPVTTRATAELDVV